MVDKVMQEVGGRPHWGKQFRIRSCYFKKVYKKWDQFWQLSEEYDPKGIFQNSFTHRIRYT
ncbi:FAD-binding oxidoreductase, partial [bacterium]|nr:FAD-binding oxidoreductase [bacterium]